MTAENGRSKRDEPSSHQELTGEDVSSTGPYEKDDGVASPEFWMAEIEGTTVTIHFGKSGTPGHRASRQFVSVQEAIQFVENRLKDKVEQGFRPA
jgi:predicted DNA-binding WGR domain protein